MYHNFKVKHWDLLVPEAKNNVQQSFTMYMNMLMYVMKPTKEYYNMGNLAARRRKKSPKVILSQIVFLNLILTPELISFKLTSRFSWQVIVFVRVHRKKKIKFPTKSSLRLVSLDSILDPKPFARMNATLCVVMRM